LKAEADWLAEAQHDLIRRDAARSGKSLRSDVVRKARGYKSRTQGGQVQAPDGPYGQ